MTLPAEQKKAVCSSLVGVVRASPLSRAIDPKQFFMTMHGNFAVLYQNGTFDLAPLWNSLAAIHDKEALYGMFLRFGEVTQRLGVAVHQPDEVTNLDAATQARYLNEFDKPSAAGADLLQGLGTPAGGSNGRSNPATATPDPPAASGISPTAPDPRAPGNVPDETQQRIAWALAQALKATPLGDQINTGQVQFMVTSRFSEMCDGRTFDFNPVMGALRGLEGFEERAIYIGIVRFRSVLVSMGIEMRDPEMQMTQGERDVLINDARSHADTDSFRVGGLTPNIAIDAREAGLLERPSKAPPGGDKKDRQLAEFGLKAEKKRLKFIRPLLILGVGIALAVGVWWTRPIKELNASNYMALFPMTRAQLIDGIFVGHIDEVKWQGLTPAERRIKTKRLEDALKLDGFLKQAVVLDAERKVVVFDIKGERLDYDMAYK